MTRPMQASGSGSRLLLGAPRGTRILGAVMSVVWVACVYEIWQSWTELPLRTRWIACAGLAFWVTIMVDGLQRAYEVSNDKVRRRILWIWHQRDVQQAVSVSQTHSGRVLITDSTGSAAMVLPREYARHLDEIRSVLGGKT